MIAPVRLCLTSDRRRVVNENDAAAAFLLAPRGGEIPKVYEAMAIQHLKSAAPIPVVEESPVVVTNKENALPKIRRR